MERGPDALATTHPGKIPKKADARGEEYGLLPVIRGGDNGKIHGSKNNTGSIQAKSSESRKKIRVPQKSSSPLALANNTDKEMELKKLTHQSKQ